MQRHAHDGALQRVEALDAGEGLLRVLGQLANLDELLVRLGCGVRRHLHLLPALACLPTRALGQRFAEPTDRGRRAQLRQHRVGRRPGWVLRLLLLLQQLGRRLEARRAQPREVRLDLLLAPEVLERRATLLLRLARRVLAPLLLGLLLRLRGEGHHAAHRRRRPASHTSRAAQPTAARTVGAAVLGGRQESAQVGAHLGAPRQHRRDEIEGLEAEHPEQLPCEASRERVRKNPKESEGVRRDPKGSEALRRTPKLSEAIRRNPKDSEASEAIRSNPKKNSPGLARRRLPWPSAAARAGSQ